MPKRDLVPLDGARAVANQVIVDEQLALSALSRALGRNDTYVQQWLRYAKPSVLPERERKILAHALQIPEASLREAVPGDLVLADIAPPMRRKPEPEFFGRRDLPVYSAVEGGPGEIVVSTDAIDMVARPWFLERVPHSFAVVVTGESMEPVYEPGDMVLVNPRAPLIRGKDAIFTSERHGGDFKAAIKRYLGATESHWLAKQFNPPKGQKTEVRFAKSEWGEALRVVGKYIP